MSVSYSIFCECKIGSADYDIDCESDVHKTYRIFAGIMILFYPIGVPAFFLSLMWPYRAELSDVAARESSYAAGKWLAFFCNDYGGSTWYWEICELVRKLVLNGVLILLAQGSLLQLTIAVIVSLIYCMLVLHMNPMAELECNYFVAFTSLMLCFTYMVSILLKVEGGAIEVAFDMGYDANTILVVCFATSIGVLAVGSGLLMQDLREVSTDVAVRFEGTGPYTHRFEPT